MEIRRYHNVNEMPGNGQHSQLSEVIFTSDLVRQEEGEELQACLGALLAIKFPMLTAHVFIDRDGGRLGGVSLWIVITSKPGSRTGGLIEIWGPYDDPLPSGNSRVCITRLDLDISASNVSDNHRSEFLSKKRDFGGWFTYFCSELDAVRVKNLSTYHRTMAIFECLEFHRA